VHRVFLSLEMLEMRFTDATDKEGDEKKKRKQSSAVGHTGFLTRYNYLANFLHQTARVS